MARSNINIPIATLEELRHDYGLSIYQIARHSGLSESLIKKISSGHREQRHYHQVLFGAIASSLIKS